MMERLGRQSLQTLRFGPTRGFLIAGLDAAIAIASLWIAMLLRFEGNISAKYLTVLPQFMLFAAVARVTSNYFMRVHRWSFRLSGLSDAFRLGVAGLLGSGLFLILIFMFRVGFGDSAQFGPIAGPPRSVVVLDFFIATSAMGLMRFSPRLASVYLVDRRRTKRNRACRALIFGAGAAGESLLRDLERSDDHDFRIVAFVDDDRSKWGMILGGRPVLGGGDDIPRLVERFHAEAVLIAIPRMPARRIREVLTMCSKLNVRFKILPMSFLYFEHTAPLAMLQDLAPEDLLPRISVDLHDSECLPEMSRRVALVTGAAGSIGSEICRQLLRAKVKALVMVDINENELYLQTRQFESSSTDTDLHVEVSDIRDSGRVLALFNRYRPDDVFHAAAHKHVPLMEAAPCEAVKNNIHGTQNIVHAANSFGARRFVYISTDKAVRPTSVMGASKRVGEMLVRRAAETSKTAFRAVRFGNVLGSAGSVVPLFRNQISQGGPVTVTDPEVRRFFMTVSEAVGLVIKAGYSDDGTLCILDMGEQIKILDLAKHMITMAGLSPDIDIPIEFTGLRPGEKLYEELLTEEEERTHRVSDKILIAAAEPPPAKLDELIERLVEEAHNENEGEVRRLLLELVPSYTPFTAEPAVSQVDGEPYGDVAIPLAER
jgi:FlaA1/EpsC-like NDP-sugar epimerase